MPVPVARGLAALLLVLPAAAQEAPRPNVVLVLADDLGWSDIGCFGGEIPTPHLDRLAEEGLRLTQMYSTGRCCPTRASLLTGLYAHQAGIGHMTSEGAGNGADWGWDAYRGTLSADTPTVAEVLGEAGYRTLMSGKWHVGTFRGSWPRDRGFDRFFGMVRGASNFWRPSPDKLVLLDDQPLETPPDFYATDAFTDNAVAFLREAEAVDDDPFFLYLSYTAPHWPLHAPDEDVARHLGRYTAGWDALRAERHARQLELGVVDAAWDVSGRDAPDWDGLDDEKRRELDHRMALYAAQVEVMDRGVGRVLATLEELGELDDTIVMFLADNGGCAEGGNLGGGPASQLSTREGYWLTYGQGWANASNTPFRRYKHWVHEGGVASPCVVRWPAGIPDPGGMRHDPTHLVDLMATFVDAAGAEAPPMEGTSLLPLFAGEALPERALFFEHEGNAAIRRGDWKLVARQGGDWELYDMAADRTEVHDLAAAQPERAQALFDEWQAWADRVGVRPWPVRKPAGFRPTPQEYAATWQDLRALAEEVPAPAIEPFPLGEPVALPPDRVEAIRAELTARAEEDQRVRAGDDFTEDAAEVDRDNEARLKELLREVGWIDEARFGAEAARDAWLIAQHSMDLALMLTILPHVKDTDPQGYALMFDRTRSMLGLPQRYGSQLTFGRGGLVLHPLEDASRVEVWRREVGLGWLSEYLAYFAEANGGRPVRVGP